MSSPERPLTLDLDRLEMHPGARQALEQVWAVLPEARLVGGVVRDLIAGLPVADIDLAAPSPPGEVMRRLGRAGVRAVPTGLAHGTVTAVVDGHPIEITTLRRDVETDGRHAVVAWTEDWRADAQRRDFTINAMSLARDPATGALELFDYFGGAADLAAGRVRFVGDPAARIAEDALRILRFFRFEARYGGGVDPDRSSPDPRAMAAIAAAAPALDGLSAERVWSELRRILLGPQLPRILRLMQESGVLDRLLVGGVLAGRLERLLARGLPADPILRLAALCAGPVAETGRALRLSNAELSRLEGFCAEPVPRPGASDAELRRLLAQSPSDLLAGRTWLAQAASPDISQAGSPAIPQAGSPAIPDEWAALRRRLSEIPRPVFPLIGRDVLACGVAPGPQVGSLLAVTRDWWMQGGCLAGRLECLDWLRGQIDKTGAGA